MISFQLHVGCDPRTEARKNSDAGDERRPSNGRSWNLQDGRGDERSDDGRKSKRDGGGGELGGR